MHTDGVCAVVIFYVNRNPLAEVGLEAVHAHIEQSAQLIGVPLAGGGVSEIHYADSRLPVVHLLYALAVRAH
jgi:hypothetical protein